MKRSRFLVLSVLLLCASLLLSSCGAHSFVQGGDQPDSGANAGNQTPNDSVVPDGSGSTDHPQTPSNPDAPSGGTEGETPRFSDFDEEGIVFTFGVLSDVHNSNESKAIKMKNVMLSMANNYRLDAFVFAGDLADKINGTASYSATNFKTGLTQLAHFAEYAVAGNVEKLPMIWCLGNHEYAKQIVPEKLYVRTAKDYTIEQDMTVLDAAYTIFEKNNANDIFMTATEGAPTGFRYMDVYGYAFFSVDHCYANEESVKWLDAELSALEEADPSSPIFVVSHFPLTHASQARALTVMLANHPSVVYLSGHTHTPMQNASSIGMRGTTAEVILGPGDHGSYGVSGPGYTYNSYSMKQGAVIEVDANGNVRVTALDFSFDVQEDGSVKKLITKKGNSAEYAVAQNPLVLRQAVFARPTDGGAFEVREDSIVSSTQAEGYFAPVLGADALSVSEVSAEGVTLLIGKAEAANLIKYYEIVVTDSAGQVVKVKDPLAGTMVNSLKIASDYIMHGLYELYPEEYPYRLNAATADAESTFRAGESYTVSVTAYDDLGSASNTVTCEFTVPAE